MKSKEIYQAIDLSKVGPELKTKLIALEKATNGFTNERADANMDMAMNKIYAVLKDKKPESLKNIEVKTVEVEEKVETIVEGKPVKKTTKTKKKVAGKKKKVAKKTATPSSGLKKPTVSSVASKIRKPNESWSDALSRAKVIFNEKKQTQVAKTKKAVDDLRDFLKDDKNFTGWPRTYGKEKASDNSLERDSKRKAMPPGKRRSDTGRVYYENRDNRADREANSFPRKIFLKEGGDIMIEPTILQNNPNYLVGTETMYEMFDKGGYVAVSEKDGYWYIMSKPSSKEEAQEVIDMGVPRGEKGKVVTLEEAKAYNKVIGREYLEKGGKISASTTYVPNRSIKELSIMLGKSLKTLKGTDIVDGIYVKNDALKSTKKSSLNSVDGIFDDIVSMATLQGLEDDIKVVKKDDIQKLLDAGYDSEDIMVIYFGPSALTNVKIDNQIGLGLLGYREDFVPKAIENLIEAAKNKTYELGLKYPDFTWSDIIKKYKIDKIGIDVNGEKLTSKTSPLLVRGAKDLEYTIYRIFEGDKVVLGTRIDKVRIVNGKRDIDYSYRPDPEEVNNFKGGYWGVVSSDKKIILDIAKMILRKNTGYVKDMQIFVNGLGGVDAETLDLNKIPYELGGEVVIPTTYLDYNPDYLVGTNTMYEMFADGGMMAKGGRTKGDIGKSGTQYGYTLKEYDEMGEKFGLFVSPKKWWSSQKGKKYKDNFGRTQTVGNNSQDERQEMQSYGYRIAIGMDLGSNKIPQSAKKYVEDNNLIKAIGMMAKGGSVDEKDSVYEIELFWKGLKRPNRVIKRFFVTEETLDEIEMRYKYDLEFDVEDEHEFEEVSDKISSLEEVEEFLKKDWEDKTNTKFAKGGYVDLQANLMKELQKLQRDLNSPRLSRYTEGDNSQEEMARQRERASKLARFNEILDLLRELESKKMAKGGAMEHMVFKGDKVLAIHRNMVIVESDGGVIQVIDFRRDPIARRMIVELITGKNTLASAMEFIDADPSFKTSTMAMGGSLQGHGFEVGDLIVEDLGGYIRVVSEDGKDFFITLRTGDRETEAPLPFKHGGKVKHSDVTRLATKTNEAGDELDDYLVFDMEDEGPDYNSISSLEDELRRLIRFSNQFGSKGADAKIEQLKRRIALLKNRVNLEEEVDLTEFYEGGGNVPKVFDVPAQFLDSEGKRKNDKKTIKELTDFVLGLPQTKSLYYNDNLGGYTPSRKKLHAEIINKFKKEVVCINNDKPIAIFMGGSPASGKSSFLRKYSPFLLKEEILKIDADEIRAMLPEYEGWNATQTHLETKDIVNILLSNKNIGIPCDFDIIYDGTMNSVKSYIPLMDILRKRGYKIFIVFMDNVPKDVIIKRALDRYKSSGRFVPLEVIEDFFTKGKSAFNELKKDVDGYMRIDGSSQDYKVLEEGGMKLPRDREYSKLGTKIKASDIPISYKKGGLSLLY